MHLNLLFSLSLLLLVGCQSPSRTTSGPAPAPVAAVAAPSLERQERALRQQQHIQALIAQNEALHTRVNELETPHAEPMPEPLPPPVARVEPVPESPPPTATQPPEAKPEPAVAVTATPTLIPAEPAILPNAEGVIDLVALLTPVRRGDEVNPFAVRTLPSDAVREITFHVQGVIHGAAACALINHRAVLPGESIDSLTVADITPDAVLIRHGGRLLRLPVSDKPVRIRLPL